MLLLYCCKFISDIVCTVNMQMIKNSVISDSYIDISEDTRSEIMLAFFLHTGLGFPLF